jgi:hypothetical protein
MWRAAVLAAACALLAAELSAVPDLPARQPTARIAGPATGPAGHSLAPHTPASDAIAQHPLFHPTREPWAPPPPPPAQPLREINVPPPPPVQPLRNYVLAGVVLSGPSRNALVHVINTNRTIVLLEGQSLEGWTLRGINRDGLHFEAGDARFDLVFPAVPEVGGR